MADWKRNGALCQLAHDVKPDYDWECDVFLGLPCQLAPNDKPDWECNGFLGLPCQLAFNDKPDWERDVFLGFSPFFAAPDASERVPPFRDQTFMQFTWNTIDEHCPRRNFRLSIYPSHTFSPPFLSLFVSSLVFVFVFCWFGCLFFCLFMFVFSLFFLFFFLCLCEWKRKKTSRWRARNFANIAWAGSSYRGA